MTVDEGSIWTEDYKYLNGAVRRVRVIKVNDAEALIRTLADGSDTEFRSGSRQTWAKLERFGRAGGYLPDADTAPESVAQDLNGGENGG